MMNVKNEMLCSSLMKEPWTIRPTTLERSLGRLLRSPEGHDDPPADPPADPSLVNDPPADPNAPPADPNAPPADPNAPPKEVPPKEPEPPAEPLTLDKLTIPEGFEVQPELSNKFLEILNDSKLSTQDRA